MCPLREGGSGPVRFPLDGSLYCDISGGGFLHSGTGGQFTDPLSPARHDDVWLLPREGGSTLLPTDSSPQQEPVLLLNPVAAVSHVGHSVCSDH